MRVGSSSSGCGFAEGVAATLAALLLWAPAQARAGVCALDALPDFAGHTFPLEPQVGSIGVSEPFPNLGGFQQMTFLTAPPTPPSGVVEPYDRIYVVQQRGLIRSFENRPDVGNGDVSILADLSSLVHQSGFEQGLLGMAFDPGFWTNGYFYVNYTAPAGNCDIGVSCTRVVRYETAGSPPALAGGDGNPTLLLEFAQDFGNHNGGMLAFGPDGMLYVSIGDGGSANDPNDRAEDITNILGSIARIDPHAPAPHVPADNPFVGVSVEGVPAAEAIFHYGLRNPWRITFDRVTGDLWIGDVGQNAYEEVDFVENGTPGGLNFGWDACEGNHDNPSEPGLCNTGDPTLTFPVIEYAQGGGGGSVTGGYVYRGSRVPSLYGVYLYADYITDTTYAWDRVNAPVSLGSLVPDPTSFGEDQNGELYVVSGNGNIYWFDELAPGSGGGPPPSLLSQTGLFTDVENLVPAPGLLEYEVNTRLWSDRAVKRRWLALPAGQTIGFAPTGPWSYPVGTAFVKHFELPVAPGTDLRIETRVLLRQTTGWVGYTYRWNDAEDDAELLLEALDEDFDVSLPGVDPLQTWHYPGPSECLGCHTSAGGRVLGGRTRQLNRSFDYAAHGAGIEQQLVAWSCRGLLDESISDASAYEAFVAVDDEPAGFHARTRSYLASNCAFCHQPFAPAPGGLDLRFDTPVDEMSLLGVAPSEGDLGVLGALRVDVGDHANSVLWLRVDSSDPALRMAAGTRIRHDVAADLLADWIDLQLPVDPDGDGVADPDDNCPFDPNGPEGGPGNQTDSDGDGTGDVCECSYVAGSPLVSDGDFDRSGVTDTADRDILASGFGTSGAGFEGGDANCDGSVDGADYTIWADDS
jgi:uncharacterized repeat protein (TIGR03806 family)